MRKNPQGSHPDLYLQTQNMTLKTDSVVTSPLYGSLVDNLY